MKNIIFILLLTFLLSQDCDNGYTYIPADEISFSTISLPYESGQPYTCFNNGDLEFLNDLNEINNLGYNSSIEIGTQTWNFGKLITMVATYTPNGSGITSTQIHTLPETIANITEIVTLYLEWNHISELPASFTQLSTLRNLYISNNQLGSLNYDFGNLSELKILDLGYNYISEIPDSFIYLENLEYLWLFNNDISYLPQDICNLNILWSNMDNAYYPYFAIGGNELCFDEYVPECILNSDHFNESLDQFYYSFMYVIEQDCPDINADNSIDILDIMSVVQAIMDYEFPNDSEEYNHMDVNDDFIINIMDLIALVNLILTNS